MGGNVTANPYFSGGLHRVFHAGEAAVLCNYYAIPEDEWVGWVSAFRRDKLVLVGTHPRPGSGTYAFTTSHMDGTGDAQQLGGLVGAHVATVGADASRFARV